MTEGEPKQRLVVLASGFGSNLQSVIDACATDALPAQITAIVSDRMEAFALERARTAGIPAVYHPWKPYWEEGVDRRAYDADLAELVRSYQPTLVILAGWMRILTSAFLDQFPMQVINLHPALPGTFPGTHAIQQAWEQFQKGELSHTGVMVHYVPDEGVDDGPVILQEEIAILTTDTLETLEARIHAVEHRILVDAVKLVLVRTAP